MCRRTRAWHISKKKNNDTQSLTNSALVLIQERRRIRRHQNFGNLGFHDFKRRLGQILEDFWRDFQRKDGCETEENWRTINLDTKMDGMTSGEGETPATFVLLFSNF